MNNSRISAGNSSFGERRTRTAKRIAWVILAGLASGSRANAQTPLHTFDGTGINHQFGIALDGAGDVNADGFDDILVGADFPTSGAMGYARVHSGFDGAILYSFTGSYPGGRFGDDVGGGGDVNNDGYDDFIVGEPWDGSIDASRGSARVYSGFNGAILYDLDGDAPHDDFGGAVAILGDANVDGFDDFAIAATKSYGAGGYSGYVRIYSGMDGSILHNFDFPPADRFGHVINAAGDVNGDGSADIVIGAPSDSTQAPAYGRVDVFSGLDGSKLHSFFHEFPNFSIGWSADGAGDVNGDGFDDIVINGGQSNFPNLNQTFSRVFSGRTGSILYTFMSEAPQVDSIGSGSPAGDVNADGFDDLLLGFAGDVVVFSDLYGTTYSFSSSGVHVFSGRDGTVLQTVGDDPSWDDPSIGPRVGVGDVNGDGRSDFALGLPSQVVNGIRSGSVRVYASEGTSFVDICNGDGGDQAGCTDCPCGNNSPAGTVGGCLNSATTRALLSVSGSPSISTPPAQEDDLRAALSGLPSSTISILVSGSAVAPANAVNPCFGQGSGVTFVAFDGLRCAVAGVRRHGSRFTDADGRVGYTNNPWGGEGAPSAGLAAASGFVAGETRYFQAIYRDVAHGACSTELNTSQAIEVVFEP